MYIRDIERGLEIRTPPSRDGCVRKCCFNFFPPDGISWTFWALLGLFVAGCLLASLSNSTLPFLVVIISGWLISLALHEFGHAVVAYHGGDLSVIDKGYLSLNLLLYADPLMTFAIPTALLLFGGVALPGGAVSIMTSQIRDKKWATYCSLAGPLSNFIFGGIIAAVLHLYLLIFNGDIIGGSCLAPALSLLIFYQIMAVVLNLLPLPPLDGWGALSVWLPESFFLKRLMQNPWHAKSVSLVSLLIIFVGVQYIPGFLWLIRQMTKLFGLQQNLIARGSLMMSQAFKH